MRHTRWRRASRATIPYGVTTTQDIEVAVYHLVLPVIVWRRLTILAPLFDASYLTRYATSWRASSHAVHQRQ